MSLYPQERLYQEMAFLAYYLHWSNEDLMERPAQIKRVTGGAQALFDALNTNEVDAIVVYSVALQYYAK